MKEKQPIVLITNRLFLADISGFFKISFLLLLLL